MVIIVYQNVKFRYLRDIKNGCAQIVCHKNIFQAIVSLKLDVE